MKHHTDFKYLVVIDIYYHKSCYISYGIKQQTTEMGQTKCEKETDVMEYYLRNFKIKIIRFISLYKRVI